MDFVADAFIILKTRITNRLMERILEIRKARGSPLSIVEYPFDIVENKGIEILKPGNPSRIRESQIYIKPPCRILEEAVGVLSKTDNVFITYPAYARPTETVATFLLSLILNGFRVLFISYKYSEEAIINMVKRITNEIG